MKKKERKVILTVRIQFKIMQPQVKKFYRGTRLKCVKIIYIFKKRISFLKEEELENYEG